MNEIPQIHDDILSLFRKYKISWETNKLPLPIMHDWADGVSQLLKIDKSDIYSRLSEIYWALSSVEMSLGYSLLSRQTCNYPKGIKGELFYGGSIPNMIGISELHIFYHLNNSWESLYRCWERFSSLLSLIFYPDEKNKLYFDDIVKRIQKDYSSLNSKRIKELVDQIKYWNKVARNRNKISHQESSPIKSISYEPGLAKIYGSNNEFIPKMSFSSANLINEINKVRDSYLRVFPTFMILKDFVEYYINDKLNLKMDLNKSV